MASFSPSRAALSVIATIALSSPLAAQTVSEPLKALPETGESAAPIVPTGDGLAPHGTFYLLSYVSARTDKGVAGFPPGQEVHFVEAHRDAQTLVVTDGRTQIEVPASKLTNDLKVAALVRKNDQASQAQITAYAQAQEAAYQKQHHEAAEITAKDIEQNKEKEASQARQAEQGQEVRTAPQVSASVASEGYYGVGGAGYGTPYSYFSGAPVIAGPQPAAANPAAEAPAASVPSKVGTPAAPAGGARPR